jgi:hypothetical protein
MRRGSASDEIHRMIPLGLTLGEARAWYRNRVVIPRLRWALAAFGVGLTILLLMLTQLGALLERSLATEMTVHDSLFLVAGFLFAYTADFMIELTSQSATGIWRARNALRGMNYGPKMSIILAFGSAGSLIAYWYLPAQFDAAAVNLSANAEMHTALLLAGCLIFVGACFLNNGQKLVTPVIVGKAMGLYGMFLLLTPWDVYTIYPTYDQVYAGVVFLILMVVLDFTIMPLWLYNYFGKASRVERDGVAGDVPVG